MTRAFHILWLSKHSFTKTLWLRLQHFLWIPRVTLASLGSYPSLGTLAVSNLYHLVLAVVSEMQRQFSL